MNNWLDAWLLDHEQNRCAESMFGYEKLLRKRQRIFRKTETLKGYLKITGHTDELLELIKASRDPKVAMNSISERFDLSLDQARAVLDLKLTDLFSLNKEDLEEKISKSEDSLHELSGLLARQFIQTSIFH